MSQEPEDSEVNFRIVEVALPETPESLYHQDRTLMRWDAFRRNLDPDVLNILDRIDAKVTNHIIGLDPN